jgi:hypothetical protein
MVESLSSKAGEGAAVQVYDATSFLPQSKAIFQVRDPKDRFLIAGAFGLDHLTVTFAKGEDISAAAARIEEAIRCLP